MNAVIVTINFKYENGTKGYDVELPCGVPADRLAAHIAQAVNGYSRRYRLPLSGGQLYCPRLKRCLAPEETLERAGIWNGDYIILQFSSKP